MNKKIFLAIVISLLLSVIIVDAVPATWVNRAFKIGDGKDIDLNGQAIVNGTIGGVTVVNSYSEIQNAINISGGGIVFVPCLSVTLTKSLNISVPNTTLRGSGQCSLIQGNTASFSLINITSSNVTVENLLLNGMVVGVPDGVSKHGILISNYANNSIIRNNYIYNVQLEAIQLGDGVANTNISTASISGNYIRNAAGGIGLSGNYDNITINGNDIVVPDSAITIYGAKSLEKNSSDIDIFDNKLTATSVGRAIDIVGNVGVDQNLTRVHITNNVLKAYTGGSNHGILITSGTGNQVVSNITIEDNYFYAHGHGVHIAWGGITQNITIRNNDIYSEAGNGIRNEIFTGGSLMMYGNVIHAPSAAIYNTTVYAAPLFQNYGVPGYDWGTFNRIAGSFNISAFGAGDKFTNVTSTGAITKNDLCIATAAGQNNWAFASNRSGSC